MDEPAKKTTSDWPDHVLPDVSFTLKSFNAYFGRMLAVERVLMEKAGLAPREAALLSNNPKSIEKGAVDP
jgi:hypothetical protein